MNVAEGGVASDRSRVQFSPRVRTVLAFLTTTALLLAVVAVFWFQDWRYSLPTPQPDGWTPVSAGETITLPADVLRTLGGGDGKPLLLHFFNPGCPCSRFNLDHVRALISEFDGRVNVVAVLQGDEPASVRKKFHSLGLRIPAVVDQAGVLAARCGVYSTPQAAIIDADGKLYFRGNYNTNRYCTAPETEFARIALTELLAGRPARRHAPEAELAYGCSFPSDATRDAEPRFSLNPPRS